MGNYFNKLFSRIDESRKGGEVQPVKQEMSTPTWFEKKILTDPRSVSTGIQRTPILADEIPVRVSKVSKRTPKTPKRYLETNLDMVILPKSPRKHFIAKSTDDIQMPKVDKISNYSTPDINTAKDVQNMTRIEKERYRILGLDPRSPAADFNRTPILAPRSLAKLKSRSQEILHRKGSYETDVYSLRNSYQDIRVTLDVPEIRLPDLLSGDLNALRSTEQHELNLPDISQSDSDSSVFDCEEDVIVETTNLKNVKEKSIIISDLTDTLSDESEEATDKPDDLESVVEQKRQIVRIKHDNKIKVWHDSLTTKENVSGEDENGEKDITFDECFIKDSPLLRTINTEINIQEKKDKQVKRIPRSSVRLKVDEKKMFSPDNKYGSEKPKNRTPLGNRSNNGQTQDTPTKASQQLLKSTTAAAIKVYQENTPPYKGCAVKSRNGIQWDPNSTVII